MTYLSNHTADIVNREAIRSRLAQDAEAWLATNKPTTVEGYRPRVIHTAQEINEANWRNREALLTEAHAKQAQKKEPFRAEWMKRTHYNQLIAKHGLKYAQIADAAGLYITSFRNILDGTTSKPKVRSIQAVESAIDAIVAEKIISITD